MRIFILVVQGSNYGSAPGGKSVSLDSNHFFPLNFVGYSKKKKKNFNRTKSDYGMLLGVDLENGYCQG